MADQGGMSRAAGAALAAALLALADGALACNEAHEYVETARTRMSSAVTAVFPLGGQNAHLRNVSARLANGDAIMLTITDNSIGPGARLVLDRVRLEDRLRNGEPMIRYDLIEARTD